MKQGLSTALQTTADAACLAAQGIQVVLRYYSRSAWKRLSAAEAHALIAAGIELGMFYEDGPTSVAYFSNLRGTTDAKAAWTFAQLLGQPVASGIYFAVDYDASAADLPAITAYFQGVQAGLTEAAAGQPTYAIGVYGSGRVCTAIKQIHALAAYSCLAESTAWSGSSTYKGWDILQSVGRKPLCSLLGPHNGQEADYEPCKLQNSFGGFTLPAPGT